MKKFATLIVFIITNVIVGTPSAFAQSSFDLGGKYNPLYIQVEQDPFQQQAQLDSQWRYNNTQQESRLKSTYGLSNFYDCSPDTSKLDLSGPHDMKMYLISVEGCLELKSIDESNKQKWTQQCRNELGAYGKLGSINYVDRTYACICQSGYVLNSQRTSCVAVQDIPARTDNQGCQSTYGVNSVSYTGVHGTPACRCSDGYEMNYGNAKCESTNKNPTCPYIEKGTTFFPSPPPMNDPSWVAPPACTCSAGYEADKSGQACIAKDTPPQNISDSVIPVKTNDQICRDWKKNTKWDGTKNDEGGLVCDCKTGYQWNEGRTTCVVPKKESASVSAERSSSESASSSQVSEQVRKDFKDSLDKIIDNVTAMFGRLEKLSIRTAGRIEIMKGNGKDVSSTEVGIDHVNEGLSKAQEGIADLRSISNSGIAGSSQDLQIQIGKVNVVVELINYNLKDSLTAITGLLGTLKTIK